MEKNIGKFTGAAADFLVSKIKDDDKCSPLMKRTIRYALTAWLYDNLLYKVEEGVFNVTGVTNPFSDYDYERFWEQIFDTVDKKLFKGGGKTVRVYSRDCKITMEGVIALNPDYTPRKKTVSPWIFNIVGEIIPIK